MIPRVRVRELSDVADFIPFRARDPTWLLPTGPPGPICSRWVWSPGMRRNCGISSIPTASGSAPQLHCGRCGYHSYHSFGGNRYRLSCTMQRGGSGKSTWRLRPKPGPRPTGRPTVIVAGSMGPTGEIFAPVARSPMKTGLPPSPNRRGPGGGRRRRPLDRDHVLGKELRAAVEGAATTGLPIAPP
jgi:hypothetical protein